MVIVPLSAVPSQVVKVVLSGQNCAINITQKTTGVYCDLSINSTVIWTGAICQNNTPICNYAYLPFIGKLVFFDTQGVSDPDYSGFDTRYQLLYLLPGEGAQQ